MHSRSQSTSARHCCRTTLRRYPMSFLVMIAALMLLILIHEFGHWIVARKLGFSTPVYSIGFGKPYLVIGRKWGTEFRVTPWLLGGYVAIPELGDESSAKEFMAAHGFDTSGYTYKFHPVWKRTLVAIAGVAMNVLFALVVTFGLLAAVGKPYADVKDVFISNVNANPAVTIARDAGLQSNDVIVAVDGQAVKSPNDLVKLVTAHKGTPAVLTVQRPGESAPRTITVVPNADGKIGIAIGAHQELKFEKVGVGQAAGQSVTYNVDLAKQMLKGLGMLLHIVPKPADLPDAATEVHGIVAIVQIGATALGFGPYIFIDFLVRISMMLAVMNILPVPLLDGGYLLFLGLEKLRGKPLSKETQSRILGVSFFLLMGLMLLGLFNDVFKPVKP